MITHAKALVADGETVLMGSSNWTASAFERNVEANALIRLEDEFGRKVVKRAARYSWRLKSR